MCNRRSEHRPCTAAASNADAANLPIEIRQYPKEIMCGPQSYCDVESQEATTVRTWRRVAQSRRAPSDKGQEGAGYRATLGRVPQGCRGVGR